MPLRNEKSIINFEEFIQAAKVLKSYKWSILFSFFFETVDYSTSLFCLFAFPSAGEAGEAAAEEREDSLQGPLRAGQGEEQPAAPTRPQRQQWRRGRRVVREGGLEGRGQEAETHDRPLLTREVIDLRI